MDVTVEAAIAAIPAWRGHVREVTLLSGGLTNHNYLVRVDDTPYVVRIPGAQTELLAIDRANELYNTRAAGERGRRPRVIHELPELGVTVLEWLAGRTMSNEAFAAPDMPARIADGAPPAPRRATLPRRLRHVPADRATICAVVRRARRSRSPTATASSCRPSAASRRPSPTGRCRRVPCHNDLLAENYLDDGTRLRIVDYEYSGNNDPTFELGNTCQELGWDDGSGRGAVRRVLRTRRGRPSSPGCSST